MRRDKLYLSDIVQAADGIARFIAGVEPDAFAQSDLLRSAVVHKLSVIGEAAARVSEDLKIRNPQVPWGQIVGFRNILIHAYFGIDWELVWQAATKRCPTLREQVAGILGSESTGAES
jgi:uncharacterized protein with HEPN domain